MGGHRCSDWRNNGRLGEILRKNEFSLKGKRTPTVEKYFDTTECVRWAYVAILDLDAF